MTYHIWQDMWTEKFYLCIDKKIELDFTDMMQMPFVRGLSEKYPTSEFVKKYKNEYDGWVHMLAITKGVDI